MLSTENQLTRSDKDSKEYVSSNAVLMDGVFETNDALDLIAAMYQQKVRFHESKIQHADSEEDIKLREEKIKALQLQLGKLRAMMQGSSKVQVHAEFTVHML
jgi:hypothetical protein